MEKDELVVMVTERVYKKLEKLVTDMVTDKLNVRVEDIVCETIKELKLEEKFEKL